MTTEDSPRAAHVGPGRRAWAVLGTFMADYRISSVLLVIGLPFTIIWQLDGRGKVLPALLLVVLVTLLVSHVATYHSWWVPAAAAVLSVALVLLERAHRHPRLRGPR